MIGCTCHKVQYLNVEGQRNIPEGKRRLCSPMYVIFPLGTRQALAPPLK